MTAAVMVYRRHFLPRSETFVADHIRHLRRWRPVPACTELVDEGTNPAGYNPLLVNGARDTRLARLLTYQLGQAPRLAAALRREGVRLVHAHFLNDGARIARFAARQGLPLVVTAHGFDATIHPDAARTFDRFAWRNQAYLQRTAAAVVCVSGFIRDELARKGYPPERLVVNPLGISLDGYRPGLPPSQRRGVLFAGRLVEKKGVSQLLRAWPLLPAGLQRERLTIIGGGGEEAALRALAQELGVAADFRGPQTRGAIRDAMLSHRAVAFPSLRAANGDAEGMGLIPMEAQALGTPVLAFDDGPAREVLSPGHREHLARPGDAEHYAKLLAGLLAQDALADQLGAEGPAWVAERFDIGSSTARLEAIYDRVASGLPPA